MVSAPFLECSIIPSTRALAHVYSYPKGAVQLAAGVSYS
jgi:hypothetical protein